LFLANIMIPFTCLDVRKREGMKVFVLNGERKGKPLGSWVIAGGRSEQEIRIRTRFA